MNTPESVVRAVRLECLKQEEKVTKMKEDLFLMRTKAKMLSEECVKETKKLNELEAFLVANDSHWSKR